MAEPIRKTLSEIYQSQHSGIWFDPSTPDRVLKINASQAGGGGGRAGSVPFMVVVGQNLGEHELVLVSENPEEATSEQGLAKCRRTLIDAGYVPRF